MNPEIELVAGHLTLRPPVADDAPAIADAARRSVAELAPWMPWAVPSYDAEDAARWIRGEIDIGHRFVVIDGDTELVGAVSINAIDEVNRAANLGYWMRSDRAGQGYATTATQLAQRYGHDEVGLHRIEISMAVENTASRRVAEKSGAEYEGVRRGALLLHGEFHDAHCFAFVAATPRR